LAPGNLVVIKSHVRETFATTGIRTPKIQVNHHRALSDRASERCASAITAEIAAWIRIAADRKIESRPTILRQAAAE
jgi:hypothetical protein